MKSDIDFLKELLEQKKTFDHIKEDAVADPTLMMQGTTPPPNYKPEDLVNSPLVSSTVGTVISNMPTTEEVKGSAIVDDGSYFDGWNRTQNYRSSLGNGMQITTINGGSLEYGYSDPTEQREYLCWNKNGYFISKYSPETTQFTIGNQPVSVDLWRELPAVPR